MYFLWKKLKVFLFILLFINVITSNRKLFELAQGKIKAYWKCIRLSHGTQRTESPTRPLEGQKTRKLWEPWEQLLTTFALELGHYYDSEPNSQQCVSLFKIQIPERENLIGCAGVRSLLLLQSIMARRQSSMLCICTVPPRSHGPTVAMEHLKCG